MPRTSRWAGYKEEILGKCEDFTFVYADLQPQRPSGSDWFETRCPFHEDERPSFAYHRPTGNWKCHAGCGEGDVIRYLMLSLKTDFKGALRHLGERLGVEPPSAGADPVATYVYRDEQGDPLFEVVRFGGKKFRQRRPDGSGGWVWKLGDVRRVLYRLPDLLARRGEPVFLVEGEKDADRLHAAGRLATTNSGGAGKWRDEYTEILQGRAVTILPDNDEPGRGHAAQIVGVLSGVAASVRIIELPGLPEKGDVSDWLDGGHTLDELDALVAATPPWQPSLTPGTHPQIMVSNRQLRALIAEAWRILLPAATDLRLFRGAGGLARIVDTEGGPQISLLDEAGIYGLLARRADWVRRIGNAVTAARPPKDLARDLLSLPDSALPVLEAVVTTPVFTPQGRLLTTPGYDPASRLWYEPTPGFTLPDIPDEPTEDDAAEAVRLLTEELLVDFPFAAESDEAHALAALFLPFVRYLIPGCAPVHDIEGTTPGSGKGLLADLISIVARGRACEATTLSRDENETRKKITALLARGASIVLLDNIREGIDSSQLAAALTAEVWSDRILGQTRMVEFPNRATWLITANNPKLSLEIARRSLRIRLEPHEERPWERAEFKHDPIRTWALQQRPQLVAAVLTLGQGWLATGRPAAKKRLGSFEGWSAVIGGILQCAGVRGFLEDREEFYAAADPDSQEWGAFFAAWATAYGSAAVAASALLELAEQNDLLAAVLGDKSASSQRARLGKALARQRGRRFGDSRLEIVRDEHAKAARYRLRPDLSELFDFGSTETGLREVVADRPQPPANLPQGKGL